MANSAFRIAAVWLFALAASHAQQPEFEVASVRPSSSQDSRTLLQVLPGGGLKTSGATLKFLVALAYEARSFQILGGPGWINSDRFDVLAKTERSSESEPHDPSKVTAEQLKGMQALMRPKLQALLVERFKLGVHRETKEQPVYALVVGKNGSKLREVTGNFGGWRVVKNQLTASGATLEMLTVALGNQLQRPVLDRTGLMGTFDFTLQWAAPEADANGPSIFTAVQEQLGLRLESTRGPVEVLVIDHVDRPSEN